MPNEPPLQEFAENVDSVLWVIEDGPRLTYVNPAFERIWGFPIGEVLGPLERFLGTIHPEDLPRVLHWVEEGTRERNRRSMEYRILRPDGELRWIRTRAFPVSPPPDGTLRFSGLSDDVTEERQRQEELERTSRRLQRTFESLHEAVFIVDPQDRTIKETNAAASRMFGYERSELLGAPTRLLHTDDTAHRDFGEASRNALLKDEVYRTEFTMRRKDGSLFETEHTVTRLDREGDEGDGVVSVVRDLSGRKDLERRLYQAQRLEAVGRLAGGVAHDFNNLLTVIRSNAEILSDDTDVPEPHRLLLDEIRDAAVRGGEVTTQLLAFSRRQVLEPQPREMGQVLREMERLLRRLLGEDVQVHLVLPEGEATAEVDQSRLEQALLNMAMNARQAMPEGGTFSLVVRREETLSGRDRSRFPEAGDGAHVLLEVRDTGRGMDRATLVRIFEPFFTTRGSEGGTGLGLPSVYGMVTQSGGSITVESEPGKGTTFFLCFPASARAPVRATPAYRERTSEQGRGERVLIVEDEATVRRALTRILERSGYEVLAVESTEEALILLEDEGQSIDLCITDLVLAGASGMRLVEAVEEQHPGIRTLLMSGYSEERLGIDPARLEALPFLPKPFSAHELSSTVRNLLDRVD